MASSDHGLSPDVATVPAGTDSTEVEWQFDALDLRPVERWLADLPGTNAGTVTVLAKPARRLVDRYLDTEDWRVGRAGYVLRTRRRGRHDEATLKNLRPASETGLRQRTEVTETLTGPSGDLRGEPGPVGTRVAAMAGRRPLRQVLEVRTRRRPFSLRVGGTEVAELALDDTSISLGDQQHPVRLRRVEVEVDPAWVERMAPLVADLAARCGLRPAELSKFEAGLLTLGLAIPGPPELGPVDVGPDSSLGQVTYAVLRRHLAALIAHEPGTRLGEDPEELHDMRVATRRLRAAMAFFGDALPPRAVELRQELGWLADALGRVRDLDVQLARVSTWRAASVGDSDDYGAGRVLDEEAAAELYDQLTVRWRAARTDLLVTLDSSRYGRLVRGMTALVRRVPPRRGPLAEPAALVVPDLLGAHHRAAAKAARRALRSGAPSDYHRLRIRGKRLRYALECTAELYPSKSERFVKRLVRLQDQLGLMQDAEVAMGNLRQLAVAGEGALSPTTVFAMGAVAERYRAEAALLMGTMPKRLKVLDGPEWKALATTMRGRRRSLEAERAERAAYAERAARASALFDGSAGTTARPGSAGTTALPGPAGTTALPGPAGTTAGGGAAGPGAGPAAIPAGGRPPSAATPAASGAVMPAQEPERVAEPDTAADPERLSPDELGPSGEPAHVTQLSSPAPAVAPPVTAAQAVPAPPTFPAPAAPAPPVAGTAGTTDPALGSFGERATNGSAERSAAAGEPSAVGTDEEASDEAIPAEAPGLTPSAAREPHRPPPPSDPP